MNSGFEIEKEYKSIIPAFDEARQISDKEALRLAISALCDPELRKTCQDRLAYAEEQSAILEQQILQKQTEYVDKHLKPYPELAPASSKMTRSYETQKQALEAEFLKTPEYIRMRERADRRIQELYENVTSILEQAASDTPRKVPSRQEFDESRSSTLRQAFERAVGR